MGSSVRGFEKLLLDPVLVAWASVAAVLVCAAVAYRKPLRFIVKSLARNKLRTTLTGVATVVLVFVVTLIWSVLWFLDLVTEEKSSDLKAIVTERWQLPSQMPFSYAASLSTGAAARPGDVRPDDSMTWQFYGATIDPDKRTRENIVFFFSMEPAKLLTMMDGIDEMTAAQIADLRAAVRAMEADKRKVIVGKDRLKAMNKQVGERVVVTGMNYTDINLEVEIAAVFPEGRYNQSAVMNRDYLNDAMDDYNRKAQLQGKPKHPLTEKSLNLVWLKVPDTEVFRRMAEQVETSSLYTNPSVKVETASSGIASFLDAYRDLLWGMRWLLVPAILVTMALVVANAISINVRERRTEMAVLKVLGYGPGQVMGLVLGEAVLVGAGCGFVASAGTYYLINEVVGGVKFPIAFFPAFLIPVAALWWGPMIGGLTALAGSLLPAWSARTVKVSEVFAKIS